MNRNKQYIYSIYYLLRTVRSVERRKCHSEDYIPGRVMEDVASRVIIGVQSLARLTQVDQSEARLSLIDQSEAMSTDHDHV